MVTFRVSNLSFWTSDLVGPRETLPLGWIGRDVNSVYPWIPKIPYLVIFGLRLVISGVSYFGPLSLFLQHPKIMDFNKMAGVFKIS